MPRLITQDLAAPPRSPHANTAHLDTSAGRALQSLGHDISQASQIMQVAMRQRARRLASDFEIDLREQTEALRNGETPLEEQGEAFDSLVKKLESKYTPIFGDKTLFRDITNRTKLQVGVSFKSRIQQDQVREARADHEAYLESRIDFAASVDDPDERGMAKLEATMAVDEAEATGLISALEAKRQRSGISESVSNAVARRLINNDPAAALEYLETEFEGDPERKEIFRSAAATEIKQRLQLEESARKRGIAARRKAEKAASVALEKDLIDSWFHGTLDEQAVHDARNTLSPGAYARSLRMLKDVDGRVRTNQSTVRSTRDSLFRMAIEGQEINKVAEAASEAFTSLEISMDDYNTIISVATDKNHSSPMRTVFEFEMRAGDVSNFYRPEAMSEFSEWIAENPSVSRTEAGKKAHEIVLEHTRRVRPNMTRNTVIRNGIIDIGASYAVIKDKWELGKITDEQFQYEIKTLKALDEWSEYVEGLEKQ